MSKTPIEMMLEGVTWIARENVPPQDDGIPYATHEGVLELMGVSMRVYRLSSGQAVVHADDMEQFLAPLCEADFMKRNPTPPPKAEGSGG